MPFNKAKGRMFKSVGWTWNPIAGCTHACKYCWAKSLCDGWGRSFEPQFRSKYMLDKFPNDGTWIFVGSMGDLFCRGMKDEWILNVLSKIYKDKPDNKFLLQTKAPNRFMDFAQQLEDMKDQIILGTTIETTWETPWSKAPPTDSRFDHLHLMKDKGFKTFLSLEPISSFNPTTLRRWINFIEPEAIEIGLENYSNHLPKPRPRKLQDLLSWLDDKNIQYVRKPGLDEYLKTSALKEPEK